MSLFRKLLGADEPSIQDQVDAISAEESRQSAAERPAEVNPEFTSVFDPLPADHPDNRESPEPQHSFWESITGLGGFVGALKSGEFFYRQLDQLASEMSPDQRLEAVTNGVAKLSPQSIGDLANRLGVSADPTAVAEAINGALFSPGGVKDLVRRIAPNSVGADGEVDFFAAVKDPTVQELMKALFPAFAEVRNQQQPG